MPLHTTRTALGHALAVLALAATAACVPNAPGGPNGALRGPAGAPAPAAQAAAPRTAELKAMAGRYTYELYGAPAFAALTDPATLAWLDENASTADKTKLVGGRYVVGSGCKPHNCPTAGAFIVIDTQTGGVLIQRTENGKWGVQSGENAAWKRAHGATTPPSLHAAIQAWRTNLD